MFLCGEPPAISSVDPLSRLAHPCGLNAILGIGAVIDP
jgi:hypothetical protein